MNEDFEVGDTVNVTAKQDDVFQNDFTGTVVGLKDNLIQVADQDGDVWDCDKDQCEKE